MRGVSFKRSRSIKSSRLDPETDPEGSDPVRSISPAHQSNFDVCQIHLMFLFKKYINLYDFLEPGTKWLFGATRAEAATWAPRVHLSIRARRRIPGALPTGGSGQCLQVCLLAEYLSNRTTDFNKLSGNIYWTNINKFVAKRIQISRHSQIIIKRQ